MLIAQRLARGKTGPRLRGGDKLRCWPLLLRLVGAALVLVASAGTAAAHAVLLGSDPPHRAALARAPHHLVLRFNEPVTPIFVRLVDSAGRERALPRPAHAVDSDVHAHLPDGLEAGSYVASFRVVSADGHPVAGAILFAVGGALSDATGAVAGRAEAAWRWAAIANRTLHILCLFLAAGGLLFFVLVQARQAEGARRSAFAAIAAVTALTGIVLHGAALNGTLDVVSAVFWRTALSTPQAASAIATLAGLALAFAIAPRIGVRAGRLLGGAGAALALGAAGVTGHSAAAGVLWWPVAALHLVAAGFWFGSLPPLWRLLRSSAPAEATDALQRFSRIAVPAVVLLAAAGAALALQRMHGLEDLLVTDYGRLVLAKIGGAALLVAIAARNKLALTPAVSRGAENAARRLRLAVAVEMTLMSGVIALAAILAHTDPHAGHGHHHHETPEVGLRFTLESGERTAAVELHPGKPGRNVLVVAFAMRNSAPFAPLEASVELALPSAGIEGLTVRLSPLGQGKFTAEISEMALPGRWRLRIDALVTDFEKAIFRGEAEIR